MLRPCLTFTKSETHRRRGDRREAGVGQKKIKRRNDAERWGIKAEGNKELEKDTREVND
jgi:hypothetical protein